MRDMLRTEFEVLTGKLIRGDLTPIVYELIRESPYIDDIFEYSSVAKEEAQSDSEKSSSQYADEHGSAGPSFESWFANEVQSITVRRVRK